MGWGSWANTQKLAGKEDWPFELYYWDYAIGVFLTGILFAVTLGSFGEAGMGAAANLGQAEGVPIGDAMLSGALFNISNILLVVAIDAAGMSLAFRVGVGLALVIGTVRSYIQAPKGDPTLLFVGVAMIVVAMIMSALAYSKLPPVAGRRLGRGLLFAVIAGCLMGSFYPMLIRAVSPDFGSAAIQSGFLTPYTALFYFGIGLLLSNFLVNTVFMKAGGKTYGRYFGGGPKLHSLGVLGGVIWMVALGLNVIASGVAGPAISYALGQGATLVAAIWGVFIWREFKGAPKSATPFIVLMFLGYTCDLTLIGVATL